MPDVTHFRGRGIDYEMSTGVAFPAPRRDERESLLLDGTVVAHLERFVDLNAPAVLKDRLAEHRSVLQIKLELAGPGSGGVSRSSQMPSGMDDLTPDAHAPATGREVKRGQQGNGVKQEWREQRWQQRVT